MKQKLAIVRRMTATIVQIIEDEPLHAHLLVRALRQAHMDTAVAVDGHSGWEDVQRLLPSLILLDLMLPGMSGHEVCRLVRGTPLTSHIPIIMLTAVGTEEDRIAGLEMGADDYVVKPFSPREVVSRVQTVLRRTRPAHHRLETFSGHRVTVQGPYFLLSLQERQITLSEMEIGLFRYMLSREGQIMRVEDFPHLFGDQRESIARDGLDRCIRFLRRKLENSGAGSIEIFPGSRYRFLTNPRSA